MMNEEPDAIMMAFPDDAAARLAAETLDELGYEPCAHGNGRLHIHVRDEDLVSALEIMQCHGGRIAESVPEDEAQNTITIPAHTVNEDWTDEYARGDDAALQGQRGELADEAPYDHFEAT